MEPRYLTYVVTTNLLLCGCWKSRILGCRSVTIGGWHIRVSSYPVRGNPALCWQRSGLVLGSSFLRRTMWQWEVPWPDHLLEIQRNNTILYGFSYRTYHSLMVAPHCLDGSYSRHKCEMPMLAKIYIFIFEMIFPTL